MWVSERESCRKEGRKGVKGRRKEEAKVYKVDMKKREMKEKKKNFFTCGWGEGAPI